MTSNFGRGDRERIERIREAWEAYDDTGNVAAIADYLAEDIVLMPPGEPVVVGKERVLEFLTPSAGGGGHEADVDQVSRALLVSGDLAVDRVAVMGTRDPTAADDPVEESQGAVDVYRRDSDGSWKCVISIWNGEG